MKIRTLKANEIECKVATISEKGCQLLLYKTARTDMDLLDETYGPENWECEYKEIKGNLYCGIRVYFGERSVIKWDCGIESAFGDKEKGEASDAMKRAGFKWGIGRSLYSSPFVWVQAKDMNIIKKGNGFTTYDRFSVVDINYNDEREISYLTIKNDKTNKIVYQFGNKQVKSKPITSSTINQVNILAEQYAELVSKSVEDVLNVLSEKYQFATLNTLTDDVGQSMIKQLNNWITLQKRKNKEKGNATA